MIFRPDMNCKRMAAGADRMCMPEVPESMFIDAVKQVRLAQLLCAQRALHPRSKLQNPDARQPRAHSFLLNCFG